MSTSPVKVEHQWSVDLQRWEYVFHRDDKMTFCVYITPGVINLNEAQASWLGLTMEKMFVKGYEYGTRRP